MMMSPYRRWILPLMLVAFLWGSGVHADSVAEIKKRGELVMLCFPHQQSVFIRVNLDAGTMPRIGGVEHFEGIDVDLMSRFAKEIGVELKIRPIRKPNYRQLIPTLLSGKGDVIASSFSIIPERQRKVAFTEPYFSVYPVVVAKKGSSLVSLEDLNGLTAVTVAGSSNERKLRQLDVELARVIKVDFMIEAFSKIVDSEADFILLESAILRHNLGLESDLEVAFRLPGDDHYGFAVPSGSDLRESLNRFLARMKAEGTLEQIIEHHFGDRFGQVPPP